MHRLYYQFKYSQQCVTSTNPTNELNKVNSNNQLNTNNVSTMNAKINDNQITTGNTQQSSNHNSKLRFNVNLN